MKQKETLVLAPGESRTGGPLRIYRDQIKVKLSGADTGGTYAIVESTTQPQSGPPLHRHSLEDESFYVLEGQYTFEVDGQRILAGPGTALFAPRGTVHTFMNVGSTPGRMLTVVQPAGLDSFFVDMDAAVANEKAPDFVQLAAIYKQYGLELLGPPLAAVA